MSSYRWLVLAVGTSAQAAAAAFLVGLAAIAPQLRAEYDLSLTGLGMVLGAPTLGTVVAMLPWGHAADRVGERLVMAIGLLITSALLVLVPSLPGLVALLPALFVAGSAASGVNAASGRAVMAWFPAKGRAFAMAVRQCGLPFGAALAAAVLPVLADRGGTRLAFWGLAAFAVANAVAIVAVIRPRNEGTVKGGRFWDVVKHRPLLQLCAVVVLLMMPQAAILGFGIELLISTTALTVAQAAVALAAVNLSGAGIRLLIGWWADWTGVRLRAFLFVAVCIVGALDALAVYIALGGPFLEVFVVLVGALALSWNGLAFVVAAEMAPPGRAGSFLGFENTAIYGANAMGAVLVGLLADRLDWASVIGALTLPALVAATLLAFSSAKIGQPST